MVAFPPANALILIAVMPNRRDFEIARLLGWYRIPLRFAPKVVDVDYLAFYQTAAFGEEARWQIGTFAQVRGHELTTRKELFRDEPEHPRSNEEYYKIQIGPLQILETPIVTTSWRRLTFLYTTGDLFSNARTINDLVVRSEERDLLWKSLRDRAMHGQESQYVANNLPEFVIEPALLAMLGDLGQIAEDQEQYQDD
ncbi:MAG TPA: hypothetical protein VKF38_04450 [Anaerolineaceae bacterium]|nr:hypothetical protein [Anaerolineaceae bacterium]